MAITQVRAQFGGQWYTLTWNETSRRYECSFTPTATSHHQPGGAYSVTVEATNEAGVTVTADGSTIPGLSLTVNETTAPVLVFNAPAAGYVTENRPSVVLTATDETGGSGVDPDSLTLTLDGGESWDGALETETVTGGFRFTFTPTETLREGLRTVRASVRDYDGNLTVLTHSFTVDTEPPELWLRPNRTVVDTEGILLTGRTGDVTAPPVTVTVVNNGQSAGTAEVTGDAFRFTLPLTVGENHITLTATDGAGLETSVETYVIRLITDRTETQVKRVQALAALGWDHMSEAERAEFSLLVQRGVYNASDLNRVLTAAEWLSGELVRRGYAPTFQPVGPDPWQDTDWPTDPQGRAYTANAERIRAALPTDAPPAPEGLDGLTWKAANDIEEILVQADGVFPLLDASFIMAGEVMSGEF